MKDFGIWVNDLAKEMQEKYKKEEAKLDKAIQDMKECNEETDKLLDEMYGITFDMSNLDTDCDVSNIGE